MDLRNFTQPWQTVQRARKPATGRANQMLTQSSLRAKILCELELGRRAIARPEAGCIIAICRWHDRTPCRQREATTYEPRVKRKTPLSIDTLECIRPAARRPKGEASR